VVRSPPGSFAAGLAAFVVCPSRRPANPHTHRNKPPPTPKTKQQKNPPTPPPTCQRTKNKNHPRPPQKPPQHKRQTNKIDRRPRTNPSPRTPPKTIYTPNLVQVKKLNTKPPPAHTPPPRPPEMPHTTHTQHNQNQHSQKPPNPPHNNIPPRTTTPYGRKEPQKKHAQNTPTQTHKPTNKK